MKNHETSWVDHSGDFTFAQVWEPETGAPRAVVCLVHGLGEHSSRYSHVAARLTAHGLAVLAHDLRGHGKSAGVRGHISDEEIILANIDRAIDEAKKLYANKPVFLYGHSLGGLYVLFYALKRKPDIKGVVATGPALRSSLEEQKFKIFMAKLLAFLAPRTILSTGLAAKDISRDPDVVKNYIEDPLVHDRTSAIMAVNSFRIIREIFQHAEDFHLPLLIMHGTGDKIALISGSQDFARRVKSETTLKLWDGLFHEIHNEPEKDEVIDFLINWLDNQI